MYSVNPGEGGARVVESLVESLNLPNRNASIGS